MKELRQGNRISYGETVKVNIGDYESRDVHISFSTDVEEDETVDQALVRARSTVRTHVTKYEKRIRLQTEEFVDFNTMAKIHRDGVKTKKGK